MMVMVVIIIVVHAHKDLTSVDIIAEGFNRLKTFSYKGNLEFSLAKCQFKFRETGKLILFIFEEANMSSNVRKW